MGAVGCFVVETERSDVSYLTPLCPSRTADGLVVLCDVYATQPITEAGSKLPLQPSWHQGQTPDLRFRGLGLDILEHLIVGLSEFLKGPDGSETGNEPLLWLAKAFRNSL